MGLRSGFNDITEIIGTREFVKKNYQRFKHILQSKNEKIPSSLDMAKFLADILTMKKVNIGQLKNNLSNFLSFVEKGEAIAIYKRNIPIAMLVPHGSRKTGNRTKLGCGLGTVKVEGDLTEPLISEDINPTTK